MMGHRVASGGAMLVGARLLTRLVDLFTLLVLARILSPADFGLVAIATGLLLIVETALELPINQALVRLPSVTTAQYDTAFTLSVLRGLVLGPVLAAAAWPFAHFYGDVRLVPVVVVLSISSITRGVTSPTLAHYQKSMSFWRDLVMEVGGKLVGFTVSLTTALLTGSYWSLVAGTIASPTATLVLSYVLAPYRPRLSLSEIVVFRGFVGWSSAAQVVSAFNWQFERLLLAKLMVTSRLGLFTASNDIASMPFMALFGPILRPLLAAFSALRDDPARLARSYQTASASVVTLGLPILVGEFLVAKPTIRLILGEQWLEATPLLRWLALSMIPALFAMPASPLVMSFGETRILLQRNLLEFCVKFPAALAGGLLYGFYGIIAARFVSELVAGSFCLVVVKRRLGLSISRQLLAPWRSLVATAVMAGPVLTSLAIFPSTGTALGAAIRLAAAVMVGIASYVATLAALWHASGRPAGVEAMAMDLIRRGLALRRSGTRPAARQPDQAEPPAPALFPGIATPVWVRPRLARRAASLLIPQCYRTMAGDRFVQVAPLAVQRTTEKLFDFPITCYVRASPVLLIRVPRTGSVSASFQIYGRVQNIPHRTARFYRDSDPAFFARAVKIAIVRDPWARLVSAFEFLCADGADLARPNAQTRRQMRGLQSLEQLVHEYLEPNAGRLHLLDPTLHPQYYYICDAQARILVDHVFHTEDLAPMAAFLGAFGLTADLPHLNASHAAAHASVLTPHLVEAIGRIYARDAELFGYAYAPPAAAARLAAVGQPAGL